MEDPNPISMTITVQASPYIEVSKTVDVTSTSYGSHIKGTISLGFAGGERPKRDEVQIEMKPETLVEILEREGWRLVRRFEGASNAGQ